MRQQTQYNEHYSNTRGENNYGHSYDPNDVARDTLRQQTQYNDYNSNARGENNYGHSYDPTDVARYTGNEDLVYSQQSTGARSRVDKGLAFNPKDIPATTLKELLISAYNLGVARGTINKGQYFNPNDIPATTLKEMLVHNQYMGHANREDFNGGYLAENPEARETFREMIKYLEIGGLKGYAQPTSQMAERNMEHDPRKEMLLKERDPTQRGHDEIKNKRYNVGTTHLRNAPQIYRAPTAFNGNNTLKLPSNYRFSNERTEVSRLRPDILDQLDDNPLVNNVVSNQYQ